MTTAFAEQAWGTEVTITKTTDQLIQENNWTISAGSDVTCYTSFSLDDIITISTTGSANCGSVWGNSNSDWRLYQNKSGNIKISVANGYTLKSVKLIFTVSNSGALYNGSTKITSNTSQSVTGSEITWTVGNTGSATNGQVRITSFSVTYESSLLTSNLTLTGSSNLNFNLYSSSDPQTISYTTSSTGAVTVSSNVYINTSVNQTDKTITVTPLSVTPSSQTITVSQAADDEYAAGTATFTVSIVNIDPNTPGTQFNPYTVAQALENTPSSGTSDNVYITGVVSAFYEDNQTILQDYRHRYYISDPNTENQLLVYDGKGLNNTTFINANDLLIGDVVTIYGQLTTYNGTKEVTENNYIVSLTRPTFSITLGSMVNYEEIFVFDNPEGDAIDITEVQFQAGTTIYLSPDLAEDYVVDHITITDASNNSFEAMSCEGGMWSFVMPRSNVTITATAKLTPEAPALPIAGGQFVKVTNTDDIEDGYYLIVYETGNVAFNGGLSTLDVTSNSINVTIATNNIIEATDATIAAVFFIDKTNGKLKSNSGQYIGASGNSNGLNQTDNASTYTNSFSIDNSGNAIISAVFEGSSMKLQYNKSSGQERFRYFKGTQENIQIYKYIAPRATITLNEACHDSEGNYYGTYSNSKAFVVPRGLTVSEIGVNANGTLNVQNYSTGDIVPANTGVMVSSTTAGEHTATLTSGGTSVLGNSNRLFASGDGGITATAMSTATPSCKYYRLTMHNGTELGFYWGAPEGAAFDLAANKAYLALQQRSSGQSFIGINPGGESGIENIITTNDDSNVYDLQGRRVAQPQKGLYIVNGKKVIIK